MKKIFPLLLCYVLSTTQLFALSGGPIFSSGINPIGTYSGIIQGVTETDNSTTSGPPIPGDPISPPDNSNTTASNALGLFSLAVPATGVATGAFLLFADGRVFTGTITASVDPDNDKLSGVLEGAFNFTLQTQNGAGDLVSIPITAEAIGKINASLGNRQGSQSSARLTGTANLDINFGQVNGATLAPIIARSITFTVSGFRQSTTVVAATITAGG